MPGALHMRQRPRSVMQRALNFWVPADLHEAVRAFADQNNLSIADVARLALSAFVGRGGVGGRVATVETRDSIGRANPTAKKR